MSLFTVELDL